MQVDLLVHPLGDRVPVQVMREPVRIYVGGTIRGSELWRQSSMRPISSNLPNAGVVEPAFLLQW